MMVQNPIKPVYVLDKDSNKLVPDESKDVLTLVEEYQRKGWLPYQWGVWVTSLARFKLHEGLACIDPENWLYADTDSLKFRGTYDDAFEKLNQKYRDEELSAADRNGSIHYLGIFEDDDKGGYKKFITLGAKKYAYVDLNDKLHVTISGVNKRKAPAELKKIERLKEGFVFRAAGGTESIFNDDPPIKEVKIQGHVQKITSNVMIKDSTYTVSLNPEYKRLLLFLINTDIRRSLHFQKIIE